FVPIPSFRITDTRDWAGKIPSSASLQGVAGYVIDGENFWVPLDATAVTFNVTAVDTENRGYIQIYNEEGTEAGDTSTVNWTQTGQNIANSGTVALTRRDFDLDGPVKMVDFVAYVGGPPNAKTHIVVDITGYYIPAI
ncbi:MAG: hypothetical protein P8O03_12490, partial [Ilumatobacter sp.]|nr:hypothetical protein [Ilumatobacter sp.]